MKESSEEETESLNVVYGRISWGAYDQIFTVAAASSPKFDFQDDHQTTVEVAAFDPNRYETTHPVKLTCTATGRFSLASKRLDNAFSKLAVGELPEGSRSEDAVKRQSYRDGIYHSYSLPFDQYPAVVQAFMTEIYQTLRERSSRVWRLLRWRAGAMGSHEIFQTILASQWSRDGQAPWHELPVKAQIRLGGWVIPQVDAPVVSSVQELLTSDIAEPTSEELLREAWAAHEVNPRSGLLLAVAAAEVGFKELVIDLVPEVRYLTLNVQSPPLSRLLKNLLPDLPVRQGTATSPPPELRKVIERAIEARNELAHQGKFDRLNVDLDEVLDAVRSVLRQFAYYRGFTWVMLVW
jgi:hypothetical protein